MNDLDPAHERKILLDVVEQMRDPEATARKQAALRRLILGIGFAALVSAFFLALNGLGHPFTAAFVAAVGGTAMGFGLFLDFARRQWPVTSRHTDMESVRRRLDELGAGPAGETGEARPSSAPGRGETGP